jgi:hypothetical protein
MAQQGSGTFEIKVIRFPEGDESLLVSTLIATAPYWEPSWGDYFHPPNMQRFEVIATPQWPAAIAIDHPVLVLGKVHLPILIAEPIEVGRPPRGEDDTGAVDSHTHHFSNDSRTTDSDYALILVPGHHRAGPVVRGLVENLDKLDNFLSNSNLDSLWRSRYQWHSVLLGPRLFPN